LTDGPEDALTEALNLEIVRSQRRFADLQARLIGYEIAITAIIGALDKSGALPLAAAKSAIDAAADTIAAQHLKSTGPLTVLRQLSGRLEPSEASDNDEQG
jgi:hypothetical protein